MSARRRQGLVLLGLLAVALGLGFPYFEAIRSANERPRLLQGMALVECGSWAIDGPSARGLATGPDVARSPHDGRLYPNKPPATSLVAAAAYAIARRGEAPTLRSYTLGARLLGGLVPTLLLCAFFWRRFAGVFGPAPTAAAIALYALATPAAAYAHLLFGHQLAAALLGIGAILTLDALDRRRPWWAAAGGLVAGASVAVEYAAAFAGIPLALAVGGALWRGRRAALGSGLAAAGGALAPILGLAAYHAAVFGGPLRTGYHHVVNPDFAEKHGQGLLGLGAPSLAAIHEHLLAIDTGLLWWAPLALVGLGGLVGLARRGPEPASREGRVLAAILALFVLLTVSLSFTGGWRVGPRYLVVALPAMVPGLAWLLSHVRSSMAWMTALSALATWSLVLNGLAANLWPHLDPTNIHAPLGEVLVPLMLGGKGPHDVLSALGVGPLPLAWLVVPATLAAGLGGLVACARGRRRALVGVALGIAFGGLALLGSLTLPPHPRAAANLRYIERVWEPDVGADARAPVSARLDPLTPGVAARCRARGRASGGPRPDAEIGGRRPQ